MMLILEKVLEGEDVARVRRELEAAPWKPGKRTAGPAARGVKENLQADASDARVQALERFVSDAFKQHPMFGMAARPRRLTRIMFSRYEPGMTYGAHTDDAVMGGPETPVRTDLAFTLFLAERESYDGGALTVESALGEQAIKLEPGDAVLYPAGSIHFVEPVTRGVRLAAVGWVQSLVADATQREILFELTLARARLAEGGVAREELLRLDKAVSNLLRLWAQV
ncbi:MAG TPA: Fe2+-dependent dioxygenase [Caulobacterales bacterium]|nr:Fe2+-dependent dioxygenase [Caulobacterales bacterium]